MDTLGLPASSGEQQQQDSFWTPLEQGLHDWDDLCNQLLVGGTTATENASAPTEHQASDQDSMQGTLQKIASMLSKSNQAQALHGRTTVLLTRQVLACLRGSEVDALSKTVQGLKDSADWVQQVHKLNTELKVQRYSWQQLHGQLMETQASLQCREEELLRKDQQLLVLQADLDVAQHQQRSRAESQRCILRALREELSQVQLELDQRNSEIARLKTWQLAARDPMAASEEATSHARLLSELQLREAEVQQLRQQLHAAQTNPSASPPDAAFMSRQQPPCGEAEAAGGAGVQQGGAEAVGRDQDDVPGLLQQLQQLQAQLETTQRERAAEQEAAAQRQEVATARAVTEAAQQQAEVLAAAEQRQAAALAAAERRQAEALAEAEQAAAAALAASRAQVHHAEQQLESERELAESLSKELELIQARLASLHQEHGALKRESALLAERAIMSEDGLEEARQAVEEVTESARVQVDALRSELAAAQEHVKELELEGPRRKPHASGSGTGNGNGAGHAKRPSRDSASGLGLGAAGGSPVKDAAGPRSGAAVDGGVAPAAALALGLCEAQAEVAALEQELAATRAELHGLLDLGRQTCEELGAGGAEFRAGEEAGAQPLWSMLRCAHLLFSKAPPQGPSLVKVRVLQAQMEDVLQAGLRGSAAEPPALLQELEALRRHEQRLATNSSSPGDMEAEQQQGMAAAHGWDARHQQLGYPGSGEGSPVGRRQGMPLEEVHSGPVAVLGAGKGMPMRELASRGGGWEDPGDEEDWFSQGGDGSSASASAAASSDRDDMMQWLDRWELPPLPPPPVFD